MGSGLTRFEVRRRLVALGLVAFRLSLDPADLSEEGVKAAALERFLPAGLLRVLDMLLASVSEPKLPVQLST